MTRDDVTWGAGWVEAEDRSLLLSEARYDARSRRSTRRASARSG